MVAPAFPAYLPNRLPVGAVIAFAGKTQQIEMYGWTECDGRSLEVAQYFELFNALDYNYGGSGSHFQIPDLRSQVIAPGISYIICFTAEGSAAALEIPTE